MKPLGEEIEAHQDNFEWARDHLYTTETHEIDGHTAGFKDLMQRPHYIEFMGSCPGCPETTILKLLTQITGESAQFTAAVGCSLVWGHYNLMRPFTLDSEGRGISAISSLFEDGTVFHWGSAIGRDNSRAGIKEFLAHHVDKITWNPAVQAAAKELVEQFDNTRTSFKAVDKLRIALGIKNFEKGARNDMIYAGSLTDAQITMTEAEGQELQQVLADKAPITEKSFMNYVKSNHLLMSKHASWYFAGDGAIFDIDFNGIDHIMGKGDNVNVIVFCNQVFSNTGGQLSKNSFIGQIAKNAYMGVD